MSSSFAANTPDVEIPAVTITPFDGAAAKAAFGKTIKENDSEPETKREMAREILKSQKEAIDKILTDEQRIQFQEAHPKRRSN